MSEFNPNGGRTSLKWAKIFTRMVDSLTSCLLSVVVQTSVTSSKGFRNLEDRIWGWDSLFLIRAQVRCKNRTESNIESWAGRHFGGLLHQLSAQWRSLVPSHSNGYSVHFWKPPHHTMQHSVTPPNHTQLNPIKSQPNPKPKPIP